MELQKKSPLKKGDLGLFRIKIPFRVIPTLIFS